VARIRRGIELAYARPAAENEVSFAFAQIGKQADPEAGLKMFLQALLGSNSLMYID
jgi:hypothetical protein